MKDNGYIWIRSIFIETLTPTTPSILNNVPQLISTENLQYHTKLYVIIYQFSIFGWYHRPLVSFWFPFSHPSEHQILFNAILQLFQLPSLGIACRLALRHSNRAATVQQPCNRS